MSTNSEIVKRIKEARLIRKMTQQELATALNKTAAAVSDLERGRVQVTASDLSIIADFLSTPIEFFYGEEFGDQQISDTISIIRKSDPETRSRSIAAVKMILQMQQTADRLKREPDQELTNEEIGDFYKNLITLTLQYKTMLTQLEELQKKFSDEMKSQGISIPNLISQT